MKNIYKNKISGKLYKRLNEIELKGCKTVFGKLYRFEGNCKNKNEVKINMKDIAQENLYMYKRLLDKPPTYSLNKLLDDYTKNQYYKQNACRYQSIDFYNERKPKPKPKNIWYSNSTKKFARKNNIINCKTENFYFPKLASAISIDFINNINNNYKYNNYGGFIVLRKRKLNLKKKFEDFNYKDLKKLKRSKNKKNINKRLIKAKDKDINNDESKNIKSNEEEEENEDQSNKLQQINYSNENQGKIYDSKEENNINTNDDKNINNESDDNIKVEIDYFNSSKKKKRNKKTKEELEPKNEEEHEGFNDKDE